MTKFILLSAAAALAFTAVPAAAQLAQNFNASNMPAPVSGHKVESGAFGDLTWTARSMIIGQTSTGGFNGGGDALYFPGPDKAGVVSLIMDFGPGGAFICSGSLLPDRRTILTAAHCVSDGFGTANPLTTTAYFYGGNPDERLHSDGTALSRTVSDYFINPLYTGFVIDHNDIAVLRLSDFAPASALSYDIYTNAELRDLDFTVAGYGGRSDIGGAFGTNQRTGYLREGDNNYDFRLGDADWQGLMYPIFGPQARTEFSYLSDFDNGLAANDAACRLLQASNFNTLAPGVRSAVCDLGRGAREVGVAGGDSGGPQFIDGRISSVTSYGVTFGTNFGDFRDGLNSSWGEFSGWVPTYIHTDFIRSNLFQDPGVIPEPATWGMMIAGFGLVGFAARRRRGGDMAKVSA